VVAPDVIRALDVIKAFGVPAALVLPPEQMTDEARAYDAALPPRCPSCGGLSPLDASEPDVCTCGGGSTWP
jgi:hypothetical protein